MDVHFSEFGAAMQRRNRLVRIQDAVRIERAPHGLECFEFEHAPVFFGRSAAVGDILTALHFNALIPVFGAFLGYLFLSMFLVAVRGRGRLRGRVERAAIWSRARVADLVGFDNRKAGHQMCVTTSGMS